MKLALWVVHCHWPFTIVKDNKLIDIFMDLNNKVEVPSCITVLQDVKEIFKMSWVKVSEILKVHIQCHLLYWSHCPLGPYSVNNTWFVKCAVLYNYMLFSCWLTSRESKGYMGSYLAAHISKCLHEYGIQYKIYSSRYEADFKQILAFMADNVSNNNTLVDELGKLLNGFQGSLTWVHCFVHILNLVVKVCVDETPNLCHLIIILVYSITIQLRDESYIWYHWGGWR